MNHEKNNLDRFLEGLTSEGNKKIAYDKVYERPSKAKSVIGFIISLIVLVILIGLFTLSVMYFVLIIGDVLLLVFFGVNAFTDKGIGLPKTIAYVVEDEEPEEEYDDQEEYDNQEYYNQEYDNSSFYDQDENEYEEDEEERQ